MRVLLKTTLKGSQVWVAGTMFDDATAPIPHEVLHEARVGSPLVEVFHQPSSITIVEPSPASVAVAVDTQLVDAIPPAFEQPQPEKETSNAPEKEEHKENQKAQERPAEKSKKVKNSRTLRK